MTEKGLETALSKLYSHETEGGVLRYALQLALTECSMFSGLPKSNLTLKRMAEIAWFQFNTVYIKPNDVRMETHETRERVEEQFEYFMDEIGIQIPIVKAKIKASKERMKNLKDKNP